MQNLKNVKLPSAGVISGVVQTMVYGSAATYGLYNSLFNVEGGHRAIVYNRVVGIKEKVRVAQLCVCACVRHLTRYALRLRGKGDEDWVSEKGDGLRGNCRWIGMERYGTGKNSSVGSTKSGGFFFFFEGISCTFFSPQIFKGEWRDWKPCMGTGQIGCCIPVVGGRCHPPHRSESRRNDERATSPREYFFPHFPARRYFVFPRNPHKQRIQSDPRQKKKQ